jgi:hypothetical protein
MTLPAGQVADAIEQRLDRLVKRSRGDEDPNIAYLQGIVATRLYFEELLRVVIPITRGGTTDESRLKSRYHGFRWHVDR